MPRTPIHPGEILTEELEYRGVSTTYLAVATGIPIKQLDQFLSGQQNMAADTAQRLSRYFGTSSDFWTNLQSTHDQDRGLIRG